ncbi:hypothetical protein N0V82_007509 [Gnomoniopsis sp. IMI 355080]|nr:hypothetical protein N0V82_007509 [Gnomoniopsis sp. IMI 355080]
MVVWHRLVSSLLSVSLVLGQTSPNPSALDLIPACGKSCLQSALPVTLCGANNQTCLCEDEEFESVVTSCVMQSCTVKEQLTTKNATESSCGAVRRDKGTRLLVNTILLGVMTGIVVVARLTFRAFISKADLGADDWAILAALLIGLPGTALICLGTYPNGVGKDVWTLSFDQITKFLFFFYISEIQYFINLAALKLSLLLFYLRIFPDAKIRRLLAGTVAFDILFGAGFAGAALFQCAPMDYFWYMWDGEHAGHCVNINAMGWANAGISISLDFWMLALPLSQLRGLRLHWKKKTGVAMMFMVGTL